MAKVNYYLSNKPDQNGRCLVLLYFSYSGKRLVVTTNESIHPKNWNRKSQRAKGSMMGSLEFNAKLDHFSESVNGMYRRAQLDDKVIKRDDLKRRIAEIVNRTDESRSKKKGLFDFIEQFANDSQGVKETATITQYRTALNHLRQFASNVLAKSEDLAFEEVDLDFYSKFVSYLTLDLGFSKNTVGKYVKTLKVFMNEATERGLNENLSFKSRKFKVISEDTDAIYLNEDEIRRLYSLNLSTNNRLDKARDIFIIGCWTGLRFSDFNQVKAENIRNGKLVLRTTKTDQIIVIPLHSIVLEILEKYEYNLPHVISNQKLNVYLKELGELVGFDEIISITKTVGGMASRKSYKKFELLTTHTARRSFATNQYLRGIPSRLIMMITGHKTEKSFLKYIKVSAEQEAERLQAMWDERSY